MLLDYRKVHGHCNVPRTYRHNGPLSTWVKRQRRLYAHHKLEQRRIERLERAGFVWDIQSHRAAEKERIKDFVSMKRPQVAC